MAPIKRELSPIAGCLPGSLALKPLCLSSTIGILDHNLQGGLPWGALIEWGAPLGLGGREVLLSYLAQATKNAEWVLWSSCQENLAIYPPGWAARGVDLRYVRFAETQNPLHDLKPVYWQPFFRVVVFDGANFKDEEFAYIARKSRENQQITVVVSNGKINPQKGNVWARYRLNAKRELDGSFSVEILKGHVPKTISFAIAQTKEKIAEVLMTVAPLKKGGLISG